MTNEYLSSNCESIHWMCFESMVSYLQMMIKKYLQTKGFECLPVHYFGSRLASAPKTIAASFFIPGAPSRSACHDYHPLSPSYFIIFRFFFCLLSVYPSHSINTTSRHRLIVQFSTNIHMRQSRQSYNRSTRTNDCWLASLLFAFLVFLTKCG